LNIDEKKRIAAQARAIICENDIIILDSSTTVIELAKQLADSSINIVVITNDANIAYILAMNSHIDLILVGGSIRHGYYNGIRAVFRNDVETASCK
jgi:DeoR/GlpR family transcriptional regulator of sugar metabolism